MVYLTKDEVEKELKALMDLIKEREGILHNLENRVEGIVGNIKGLKSKENKTKMDEQKLREFEFNRGVLYGKIKKESRYLKTLEMEYNELHDEYLEMKEGAVVYRKSSRIVSPLDRKIPTPNISPHKLNTWGIRITGIKRLKK